MTTPSSLQQLKELGEGLGFTGAELVDFIKEQQALERADRQAERDAKEKEKERIERQAERDWLSMVLRLRQHNIGYTADGFYRSDDPTNSVKALKEGG